MLRRSIPCGWRGSVAKPAFISSRTVASSELATGFFLWRRENFHIMAWVAVHLHRSGKIFDTDTSHMVVDFSKLEIHNEMRDARARVELKVCEEDSHLYGKFEFVAKGVVDVLKYFVKSCYIFLDGDRGVWDILHEIYD